MSLSITQLWHERARPTPDYKAFNVSLGVHIEEFVEMMQTLIFDDPRFGPSYGADLPLVAELERMANALKSGAASVSCPDRKELLDALADQIVTAVGVGHCAGMNVPEAVHRVNRSNWSKFDKDGQPIYNEQGKIAKGPDYAPPDLEGLY